MKQAHPVTRLVIVFAVLWIAVAPMQSSAQAVLTGGDDPIIQKYRQMIPQLMAEKGLPGLAIAVADDTGVLWAEGFGYTDDDRKTAVTPDTIFSVQSTSKTFTATAVMLAVQEGLLDLDAPITTYLPNFTVHSIFEEHPERKITLRHLLGHTAGFTHEAPVGNNFDLGPVSFEAHIQSISDTWLRFPVGTGYAYSNLGIDLSGYILQKVSGQAFTDYVANKLLHPLGMSDSTFELAQIRANPNRAVGHTNPLPVVPLEVPMIPSGGLYTSVNDMAKFIQFHLNQGCVNGQCLLRQALLDEMYTIPAPAQGSREGYALGVARTQWHRGREAVLFSHGGGGFGFLSDLWWLPELKIGITILTNSTDHDLQGQLALDILYDFVYDTGRVYFDRLMALPDRMPFVDGNGHYRPPIGLAQMIEDFGMHLTDQDKSRWENYIGAYSTRIWGVLDPNKAAGQIYQQGSHLYIQVNDTAEQLRLTEISTGLFYAENGEVLDFRGDVPTWRSFRMIKIGEGAAPWQKVTLAACGLVFLSGLLWIPSRSILRRFRRPVHPVEAASRWMHLTVALAILTGLFGLLSIGMVFAIPNIVYAGFLGWLDLPLWQKLLMHAPLAFLVSGGGLLVLIPPAWKYRWGTQGEKYFCLVLSLASMIVAIFLSHWQLIGFGF